VSGFNYWRTITIDHTKCGSSNSSDFPVLISGTYSWLATVANGGHVQNANGYDIIFTSDAAGKNSLNWEVESYNPATGAVIYWVQVPTVSHTTNTVIYMWYGNAAITTDQSNTSGTWDGTFLGVYHFKNGTTLSAADSSGNGNNGTISGATAGAGQIDGAAAFNLSADNGNYVEVTGLFGSPATATLSGWANYTEDWNAGGELISLGDNLAIRIDNGGSATGVTEGFYYDGSTWHNITYAQTYLGTGWHHFVFTVTADSQVLYIDGVQVASGSNASGIAYLNGANTYIGQHGNGQTFFDFGGYIDEVRVSSSVRSADWVTAEYNNQSSPSTFYSMGTENVQFTFTDGLLLSDVLHRSTHKLLSPDSFSLTDVLARAPAKKLLEAISPSDRLTRSSRKGLLDTIALTDRLTRSPRKKLPDSITPVDHLVKTPAKVLVNTISPSDRLTRSTARRLHDTISVIDALKRGTGKTFGDTLSLFDHVVSHLVRLIALSDSIALTDKLSRHTSRVLSDQISPSEAITRHTRRRLADSLSLVDGLARHANRLFHDTLSPNDAFTRHTTKSLNDVVTSNETITRRVHRFYADVVSPSDGLQRNAHKLLHDTAPVPTDRLTRATRKNLHDSFTLSDAFDYVLRMPGAVRRFWAQLWRRLFDASEEDQMITDVKKPAGSSEDFEVDWSDVLVNNDTITASEWAVTPDDMTVANSSNTTTTATGQLAGGTIGTYYIATNTVTLASGQTKVQSLLILVTE
jgi:Concanavalin A-like lectin/glucanases superfamily/Domain of unknown function (DUF2341)